MSKYTKLTKEDVSNAVLKSLSIAEVCRVLNMRPCGGNYKTLKSKFKLWEINTSHFTGAAWNKGERYRPVRRLTPLIEILIENSAYVSTNCLKKRLYKEGLKKKECEQCGISSWKEKPISLEMNHINGNNSDHRLENLEILCPNCHSQTPTYRGRNKKSSVNEKRQERFDKLENIV